METPNTLVPAPASGADPLLDNLAEDWLVPGIGKVKETGERLEELVSYDVKKP